MDVGDVVRFYLLTRLMEGGTPTPQSDVDSHSMDSVHESSDSKLWFCSRIIHRYQKRYIGTGERRHAQRLCTDTTHGARVVNWGEKRTPGE
jgi:hypothetical protein